MFGIGKKKNIEKRSYTDMHINAAIAVASNSPSQWQHCGAVEVAAGLYERAFCSAKFEAAPAWLDNENLGRIARTIITRGDVVGVLNDGYLFLSNKYKIMGGYHPKSWMYEVEVSTPSGKYYTFKNLSMDKVIHIKYCAGNKASWMGGAPLGRCGYASKLLSNLERALMQESGARVGYILPLAKDPSEAILEQLKSDLGKLQGGIALVETSAGGYGDRANAPKDDFKLQRIGANPPATLVQLYEYLNRIILLVLGVPIELVTAADGTGKREAWRQFLWGSVAPLARKIEVELSKLASEQITLTFEQLNASDITGRARAFQSLVGGGMDIDEAAALSGLVVDDE